MTHFIRGFNKWKMLVGCCAAFLAGASVYADITPSGDDYDVLYTATDKIVRFNAGGSFVLSDAVTARLLLVGGGGAGGTDGGGGGGAGGMLEVANQELAAGTYTVTVGAGGIPNPDSDSAGGSGGDSVLSLGETELNRRWRRRRR